MDATMSLVDRLKIDKHKGFNARARYYTHGDFVTYFVSAERCLAKRLSALVTVYVDAKTGALVGCKVKGVSRLVATIKHSHALAVLATDGKIALGLLFLSVAAIENEHKQDVLDLANKFGRAEVPCENLCDQAL